MSDKKFVIRLGLLLLLVAPFGSIPVYAGSAVVGSVAGSLNASMGGQALLPNTTLFSGDSLQVRDGAAVVAIGKGSRVVFGRETVASFLRESDQVTVVLGQGNVLLYHPEGAEALRVKIGELSIEPAKGFKTLGEIAMVSGVVVVTAKEGSLQVDGEGRAVEVKKGQTITIDTKAARTPQPQGGAPAAGAASSGMTTGEVVGIAGLAASGAAAAFAILAYNEAQNAVNEARAACKAISPSTTCP